MRDRVPLELIVKPQPRSEDECGFIAASKDMQKHGTKSHYLPYSIMEYDRIRLPGGIYALNSSKEFWCIWRETHRHLWRYVVESPIETSGLYGVRTGENRCIICDRGAPSHMLKHSSYMDREELMIYRFLLESKDKGKESYPACHEVINSHEVTHHLIGHFKG